MDVKVHRFQASASKHLLEKSGCRVSVPTFVSQHAQKPTEGFARVFGGEVTLEPFWRCIAHRFFHSESLGCFLIFCADDVSPTLRIFSVFWT